MWHNGHHLVWQSLLDKEPSDPLPRNHVAGGGNHDNDEELNDPGLRRRIDRILFIFEKHERLNAFKSEHFIVKRRQEWGDVRSGGCVCDGIFGERHLDV
ncbi:hypothetical protein IAR50_002578 [Cryptococcus sp. DSM 104548]